MSVNPVLLTIFASGAALLDFKYRRVYDAYVGVGLLAGIVAWGLGWGRWSFGGMAVAFICCILGNLRGGDLKASLIFGGYLDPLTMLVSFVIGYFAAIICLILYDRDVIQEDVRRWPFVPFLAVPVCAMVWLVC